MSDDTIQYSPHVFLELPSDAIVGLLQVSGVHIHLLIESIELVVLTVQLVPHISRYTLEVGKYIRHCPVMTYQIYGPRTNDCSVIWQRII